MKKSQKKIIWQLTYIIVTFLVIFFMGFLDPEFQTLSKSLSRMQPIWLLCAAGGILGLWFVQGGILKFIAKFVDTEISYSRSLKITIVGEYYSAITPFSSGGQPMQMAYYKRYNVSLAKSSAILAIRMIGYTSALCLVFIITMALRGRSIYENHQVIFWMTLIGFFINAAIVAFIICILVNKRLIERIGCAIINFITRFRWFKKKREKMQASFDKGVKEFSDAGVYLREKKLRCILTILYSLLSVLFLYSITYCIYRSMGLNTESYVTLFTMQTFLYLAVAFVPTPGAIGASEGGFYLFFAGIFPQSSLYLAMLLWRFFTYYANLLVGAVVVISDEVINAVRSRKKSVTD